MEENELFDSLISSIVEEKGGTREAYTSLLNTIAFHETGGTMDPKQEQQRGPARGKYQFESDRLHTSARRAKRYFRAHNQEVPLFVEKIINQEGGNAAELSGSKQDILALLDLRMKSKDDILGSYAKGETPVDQLWADHWWSGPDNQREERLESFNRSYKQMNELNTFNTGGSHESHPQGGIPLTDNALVEEGETSIPTNDGGHFIFSDRLNLSNIIKPFPKNPLKK